MDHLQGLSWVYDWPRPGRPRLCTEPPTPCHGAAGELVTTRTGARTARPACSAFAVWMTRGKVQEALKAGRDGASESFQAAGRGGG